MSADRLANLLAEIDYAERVAPEGLCTRHGAPLFLILLGGPWLVCRHCLENLCEACEQPASLCSCRPCFHWMGGTLQLVAVDVVRCTVCGWVDR